MKKLLFSTRSRKSALDWSALLIRVVFGVLMMANHAWPKIVKYDELKHDFVRFLSLSSEFSLGLAIFAEFLCSFLIVFGLFTRLALVPLMITMAMALHVRNWQLLGTGNNELAMLFFIGFLSAFMLGPGRFSIDGLIQKPGR